MGIIDIDSMKYGQARGLVEPPAHLLLPNFPEVHRQGLPLPGVVGPDNAGDAKSLHEHVVVPGHVVLVDAVQELGLTR